MSRQNFSKPSLSLDEQIEQLQSRGLDCEREALKQVLQRMSYYRFTGYLWWYYEDDEQENGEHRIEKGTQLEDVLRLYEFDARLRSHILELAHIIEVWLRAAITNKLAENYGPFGYLEARNFHSAGAFSRDIKELEERLKLSDGEPFISSYRRKYRDRFPPIWMATEIMSFGQLSKWYDNIGSARIRKDIAKSVGLPAAMILVSFLRVFTIFRNAAAHHLRVWSRRPNIRVAEFRNIPDCLNLLADADSNKIFYTLTIAVFIVQKVHPNNQVVDSLRNLLVSADEEWLAWMDFPQDFEFDAIWNPNNYPGD